MAIKKYQSIPKGEEYKSIVESRRRLLKQIKERQKYIIAAEDLERFEEETAAEVVRLIESLRQ